MESRDDAEDADRLVPPATLLMDSVLCMSGDIDSGDGNSDEDADRLGLLHAERVTPGLPDTERCSELVSSVLELDVLGLIGGKSLGDNDKIGVSVDIDDDDAIASTGSERKRGET